MTSSSSYIFWCTLILSFVTVESSHGIPYDKSGKTKKGCYLWNENVGEGIQENPAKFAQDHMDKEYIICWIRTFEMEPFRCIWRNDLNIPDLKTTDAKDCMRCTKEKKFKNIYTYDCGEKDKSLFIYAKNTDNTINKPSSGNIRKELGCFRHKKDLISKSRRKKNTASEQCVADCKDEPYLALWHNGCECGDKGEIPDPPDGDPTKCSSCHNNPLYKCGQWEEVALFENQQMADPPGKPFYESVWKKFGCYAFDEDTKTPFSKFEKQDFPADRCGVECEKTKWMLLTEKNCFCGNDVEDEIPPEDQSQCQECEAGYFCGKQGYGFLFKNIMTPEHVDKTVWKPKGCYYFENVEGKPFHHFSLSNIKMTAAECGAKCQTKQFGISENQCICGPGFKDENIPEGNKYKCKTCDGDDDASKSFKCGEDGHIFIYKRAEPNYPKASDWYRKNECYKNDSQILKNPIYIINNNGINIDQCLAECNNFKYMSLQYMFCACANEWALSESPPPSKGFDCEPCPNRNRGLYKDFWVCGDYDNVYIYRKVGSEVPPKELDRSTWIEYGCFAYFDEIIEEMTPSECSSKCSKQYVAMAFYYCSCFDKMPEPVEKTNDGKCKKCTKMDQKSNDYKCGSFEKNWFVYKRSGKE